MILRHERVKDEVFSASSFLFVRHAWRVTWRWKSAMGAGSCQPLAKRKGVHCEMESEGSVMSKVLARGTRIVSGI